MCVEREGGLGLVNILTSVAEIVNKSRSDVEDTVYS